MTLKQVIQRLRTLAIDHGQINHFFIGGFDEFLDDADVTYPAVFCELKPDSNISLENRVANLNFTFYFLDLIDTANRSLENVLDVTSDMSSVAQDYIALLTDVGYYDWEVSDEYDISFLDYELQDLTAGVSVDVTIGIRFDANRCQVPTTFSFAEYAGDSLTLKQVISRAEQLAASHKQINRVVTGSFDEFLDGPDVVYPGCFIELNNTGVVDLSERLTKYSFTFHFFDLMDIANDALENEFEVKSDMLSVAMDFLAMLNYHGFEHSWSIGTEYGLTIRDYQLQDLAAGVSIRVEIGTRFDANRCWVPTTYSFSQYDDPNLTLKQIVKRIEDLALSHKQINHFYEGAFDEFMDSPDITYPACFAELNTNSKISLANRRATYTFTFHFFDLLDIANRSLRNEFEVKSDMMSVALDFIAMLNYHGFEYSWEIGTSYQLEIGTYKFTDLTAGVSVRVDISSKFDANLCRVPLDGNFLLWADGQYFMINNTEKLKYAE